MKRGPSADEKLDQNSGQKRRLDKDGRAAMFALAQQEWKEPPDDLRTAVADMGHKLVAFSRLPRVDIEDPRFVDCFTRISKVRHDYSEGVSHDTENVGQLGLNAICTNIAREAINLEIESWDGKERYKMDAIVYEQKRQPVPNREEEKGRKTVSYISIYMDSHLVFASSTTGKITEIKSDWLTWQKLAKRLIRKDEESFANTDINDPLNTMMGGHYDDGGESFLFRAILSFCPQLLAVSERSVTFLFANDHRDSDYWYDRFDYRRYQFFQEFWTAMQRQLEFSLDGSLLPEISKMVLEYALASKPNNPPVIQLNSTEAQDQNKPYTNYQVQHLQCISFPDEDPQTDQTDQT